MVRESMATHESEYAVATRRRSSKRWIIWAGYALVAGVGLAAMAFLAGYLTAAHELAGVIRTDRVTILHLQEQLQVAKQRLLQKSSTPRSTHGFWHWWAGLPFQHLGQSLGQVWQRVFG